MHLTNRPGKGHLAAVAAEGSAAAGAPDYDRLLREVLEEVFYDWWGDNSWVMETGSCGDVLSLFHSFTAASAKALNSSLDTPRAS
jgi:hypothetical protein